MEPIVRAAGAFSGGRGSHHPGCRARRPVERSGAELGPGGRCGGRRALHRDDSWHLVSLRHGPVPGGTFTMGSPATEPFHYEDEGPQVQVKVGPFWMGKLEVTWAEYDLYAFAKRTPPAAGATPAGADAVSKPTPPYADESWGFGKDKQPALGMTWHAAAEYCRWLSAKTGKTYRLATEAEWEYAARAGTTTPWSSGGTPETLGDVAWYAANSGGKPHIGGQKKPNAFGLFDLHGNVAEWVIDQHEPKRYERLAALPSPRGVAGQRAGPGALSARGARRRLRGRAGDAAQRRAPRLGPGLEPARSAAPAEHLVAHRRDLRRVPHRASPSTRRRRSRISTRRSRGRARITGNSDGRQRPAADGGSDGKRRPRHDPRDAGGHGPRHDRGAGHAAHLHQVGVGGGRCAGRGAGQHHRGLGRRQRRDPHRADRLPAAAAPARCRTRSSRSKGVRLVAMAELFPDRLADSRKTLADKSARPRRCPTTARSPASTATSRCCRATPTTSSWRRRRGSVPSISRRRSRPASTSSPRSRSRSTAPGIQTCLSLVDVAAQKKLLVGCGLQRHHQQGYLDTISPHPRRRHRRHRRRARLLEPGRAVEPPPQAGVVRHRVAAAQLVLLHAGCAAITSSSSTCTTSTSSTGR